MAARPVHCRMGGPRRNGLAVLQVGVGWCLAAPVRGAPLQLSLDLQYK